MKTALLILEKVPQVGPVLPPVLTTVGTFLDAAGEITSGEMKTLTDENRKQWKAVQTLPRDRAFPVDRLVVLWPVMVLRGIVTAPS